MKTGFMRPALAQAVALTLVSGLPRLASAQEPTLVTSPASPPSPAPAAAPSAPSEKPIPSYIQLDHDYLFGLQLWAGATYPILSWLGVASDVYVAENYPSFSGGTVVGGAVTGHVTQSYWGEFDLGPELKLGPLTLTPMAGIAFDWAARRPVALNAPQLYAVVTLERFYFESWCWVLFYSPFKEPVYSDYLHNRNWLLWKATSFLGVGPQFEYTYNLNTQGMGTKGTQAMPLGGHLELAYGTGNSLGLFLGYELSRNVRRAHDGNAIAGRITFSHDF
jgi:hypothetical protein